MRLTERRWKILMLFCFIMILIGVMWWLQYPFIAAIIGGIQDAEGGNPVTVDKPDKPQGKVVPINPELVKPEPVKPVMPAKPVDKPETLSHESLGNRIYVSVPADASSDEINIVASVFHNISVDISKRCDPSANDYIAPGRVLELTAQALATGLGPRLVNWEPFAAALAVELENISLDKTINFVAPWDEIANKLAAKAKE